MLYHYLSLIPSANQKVGGMKYHRCKCEEAILGTLSIFRLRRFLNLVLDLRNVGIYWFLASSLWRTACLRSLLIISRFLSLFSAYWVFFQFMPPADPVTIKCALVVRWDLELCSILETINFASEVFGKTNHSTTPPMPPRGLKPRRDDSFHWWRQGPSQSRSQWPATPSSGWSLLSLPGWKSRWYPNDPDGWGPKYPTELS